MGFILGIDLGTTFSAAAVWRDGRAEIFSLGNKAPAIPSVVLLRDDGDVLVGEAAERRALSEPGRTGREFKRRLGDPTPFLLGGTPYGAETLTAHLLRAIVAKVTEQQGEAPERMVVCHPANYGAYKLDLLQQAVRIADIGHVEFVPEPVAAAVHYAAQQRIDVGHLVAVYDFGGGTFDAAVLRRTETSFEVVGPPEGLDRLGGIDFDQAVYGHVREALAGALEELDPDDPATVTALAHLRDECREAKEALSSDTDAQIAVLLPSVQTKVRLTRSEFESMIRPRIAETIHALERAMRGAGVSAEDIDKVLLVGGSSRIPLVAQMVRDATGRPVAIDAHPKFGIAIGAALSASGASGAATATSVTAEALSEVEPPPEPPAWSAEAAPSYAAPVPSLPPAAAVDHPAAHDPAALSAEGHVAPQHEAPVPASVLPAAATPEYPSTPQYAVAAAGPTNGNGGKGGIGVVLVVAAIAIAVLIAAGAFALTRSDNGASTTGSPTSTAAPTTTVAPSDSGVSTSTASQGGTGATSPPEPVVGPSGRGVTIDRIEIVGGNYHIHFAPSGYDPIVSDTSGTHHVHFFFNTVEPINAGTNGPQPSQWKLYGGPSPFTELAVGEKPVAATEICSLVADHVHGIELSTGNCVPIPE